MYLRQKLSKTNYGYLLCVVISLIMRDVNYGWLIRYLHANTASFFFIFVYLHIGRGLYYGSYKSPRVLLWSIGVIILVLMMAKNKWPNCVNFDKLFSSNADTYYYVSFLNILPFSKPK